jgi:hypothetical protein
MEILLLLEYQVTKIDGWRHCQSATLDPRRSISGLRYLVVEKMSDLAEQLQKLYSVDK